MPENTHRFSSKQECADMLLLLWRLGSLCIDHMEALLYGTERKQWYLLCREDVESQGKLAKEQREYLLDCMTDLLQELEMSPQDVQDSWQRMQQLREQDQQWGKQWEEARED